MNFLSQELKIRFFGLDLRVYTLRVDTASTKKLKLKTMTG